MKIRPTAAERAAQEEHKRLQGKTSTPATKRPVVSSSPPLPSVPIVVWHGCYDAGWREEITPESFAHPAKAGRNLLRRIYDHLFDIGALSRGGIVVDPFAGIFTTGIEGAWRNVHVVGCELEEKFYQLAQANIALNTKKWEAMRRPLPIIVQGDSRQLRQHVRAAIDAVISSPPYADSVNQSDAANDREARFKRIEQKHGTEKANAIISENNSVLNQPQVYGQSDGQLGAMDEGQIDAVISSPPYAELGANIKGHGILGAGVTTDPNYGQAEYGTSEGQLGDMKKGALDVVISSPPFLGANKGDAGLATSEHARDVITRGGLPKVGHLTQSDYGTSDGQLSIMEPGQVDVVVSSPPYREGGVHGESNDLDYGELERAAKAGIPLSKSSVTGYGTTPGQLASMDPQNVDAVIGSPPCTGEVGVLNFTGKKSASEQSYNSKHFAPGDVGYGESEGQLGEMAEGSVDAIVSSPPYAEIASGAGGLNTQPPQHEGQQGGRSAESASQATDQRYGKSEGQLAKMDKSNVDVVISSPPYTGDVNLYPPDHAQGAPAPKIGGTNKQYGTSEGQLGLLKDDAGVDAVVTSPPYEDQPFNPGESSRPEAKIARLVAEGQYEAAEIVRRHGSGPASNLRQENYGQSPGQLGGETGDTFWSAARDIVRECHAILKPGGHAVWIVKAFVRNRQIVDFPQDWRKLCEYCGFETLTEVHAMLVKEGKYHGQTGTHGYPLEEKTERKSFFRRLAESKGSPKIDYEVVYIMRKQ